MGLISPTSKWVLPVNHISFLPSKSSVNGRFLGYNVAPSKFSPYFSAKIFTEASEKVNTLRNICHNQVPEYILQRAEEIGFMVPTDVQQQSLPILLSGKDCILHSQTGSGKTLAYLLSIFSIIDTNRSAVQALIVVPTRELGIQVTKVARMLAAAGPRDNGSNPKACTIMSLLDGGMLKRHKSWLKAEPPEIVVATIGSLCQMIEKHIFKLEAIRILVIDEVDFMFNSSNEVQSLKKLLTSYSSINNRQTVFASASIPQHKRFLYDCIQQKWTKNDVVHIHTNAAAPMPSQLRHKFVIAHEKERFQTLLTLLERDLPMSCIIFVNEQSEKSKKAGKPPNTTHVIEVLNHAKEEDDLEILLLEENMNFHTRTATFLELRKGRCILVATDIASRGVDLPEITHIYNFNLPKTAVDYLHRAGRTGRKPFSDEKCSVTSLITPEERFALQRFENELSFQCERLDFITEPI